MGIIEGIAGGGYLLQKFFLLLTEEEKPEVAESIRSRRFRIAAWVSYLIGLPMWMVIFVIDSDWILFFVEGGGAPSMVLGLIIALRGRGKEPKWLDVFSIVMTFAGIMVSLYVFGGLNTLPQTLELGVAIGFLVGTYFLAKRNWTGWFWYLLMNGSAGTLMWVDSHPLLALQQAFSFVIVLTALAKALRARRNLNPAL